MKKEQEEEAKIPAWLVTFSDLMTLLLTFFVLLLSMSTIDTKRKLEAIGSIRAAFGVIDGRRTLEHQMEEKTLEEGFFDQKDIQDMASEQKTEPTFTEKDVEFIIDRDVAIVRIADDVLFQRGGAVLTRNGKYAVDRILPLLLESTAPVKILGSTSTIYDEYQIVRTNDVALLWRLSLQRALSIYTYIQKRGVNMQSILLEGISEFHRDFQSKEDSTSLSRARRTDFVFGKQDIEKVERLRKEFMNEQPSSNKTTINGFEFSLE